MIWKRKQGNSVPWAASAIRDTHFCIVILSGVDLFRPNNLSINQVSALLFFSGTGKITTVI